MFGVGILLEWFFVLVLILVCFLLFWNRFAFLHYFRVICLWWFRSGWDDSFKSFRSLLNSFRFTGGDFRLYFCITFGLFVCANETKHYVYDDMMSWNLRFWKLGVKSTILNDNFKFWQSFGCHFAMGLFFGFYIAYFNFSAKIFMKKKNCESLGCFLRCEKKDPPMGFENATIRFGVRGLTVRPLGHKFWSPLGWAYIGVLLMLK